ncbi:MAG: ABC transporter ATP-binding protein [Deltaproteobacteria bacterium]|nr:ABC transporter ATP-binding protein [Deltaproteobacteria bacterium]
MEENKTKLNINGLTKQFGNTTALSDIDFSVDEGEFCILLGPSGCGKSTLLRIIAGIENATHGDVFIESRNVTLLPPGERDVAMVFQSYALYPHMTVKENLAFPLKVTRTPKDEVNERVSEAAELLSIGELLSRYPRELSGGQRQRVAIGRTIVRRPKLFLFDEPLSNLDARLRVKMRVELAALHKRLGATMIYVTHDQTEAMTLGEKVVILDKGKIQQTGTPSEVYNRPENRFVASFIGSPEMNFFEGEIREGGMFRSDIFCIAINDKLSPGPASLGVRPEDLLWEASASTKPLAGMRVELVENLGPELLLHLAEAGTKVVMRCDPLLSVSEGDRVVLHVLKNKCHFYRGGRRLKI